MGAVLLPAEVAADVRLAVVAADALRSPPFFPGGGVRAAARGDRQWSPQQAQVLDAIDIKPKKLGPVDHLFHMPI